MITDSQDDDATPWVSVVIPALNVADTLGLQLTALLSQDYDEPYEIIVADNGSTDETGAVARAAGVRVVDASGRRGINHARNVGVQHARSEFILFCDGDDAVLPGWIEAMVDTLASAAAVGGTLVTASPDEFLTSRNMALAGTRVSKGILPPGASHHFLPYPIGANCGVLRSRWEDLGGFNEDYDSGASDEVEFFWRLQLAGGKLSFVDAPILYRGRSRRNAMLRKQYRNAREATRMYRDFRHQGMPRRSTFAALTSYVWLIGKLPRALFSQAIRERWWDVAARQAGRAAGCIRYRTYAP
jgi:glycosyltransferase involved in cell wall biosynthesis